jgi:hypothetical protein
MDPFHPQIMQFISPAADPMCSGERYGELVDGALKFTGKITLVIDLSILDSSISSKLFFLEVQ